MNEDEAIKIHAAQRVAEYLKIISEVKPAKLEAAFADALKQREKPITTLPLVAEDAHVCPFCQEEFKWKSVLAKHVKSKHAAPSSPLLPDAAARLVEYATALSAAPELPPDLLTKCACGATFVQVGGLYRHIFKTHIKQPKGKEPYINAFPLDRLEQVLNAAGVGKTKEQQRDLSYIRERFQAARPPVPPVATAATADAETPIAKPRRKQKHYTLENPRTLQERDPVDRAQAMVKAIWTACAKAKTGQSPDWLGTRENKWAVDLSLFSAENNFGRLELYSLARTLEIDPTIFSGIELAPGKCHGQSIHLILHPDMSVKSLRTYEKKVERLRPEIELQRHSKWWPMYRREFNLPAKWKPSSPAECDRVKAYYLPQMVFRGAKVVVAAAAAAATPAATPVTPAATPVAITNVVIPRAARRAPASVRQTHGPEPSVGNY